MKKITKKCQKKLKLILKVGGMVLSLLVVASAFKILDRIEFFQAGREIDNLVAAFHPLLVIVSAISLLFLLLQSPGRHFLKDLIFRAGVFIYAGYLALSGGFNLVFLRPAPSSSDSPVELSEYHPDNPESKIVILPERANLRLTSSLPLLDGATALYPVYAALARAVYEPNSWAEVVACSNTPEAYQALIAGKKDIIFVAAPSAKQEEAAYRAGVELYLTPIGKEAFVFLVGKTNPLTNLTLQQVRNIYSGKISRWKTLGWKEGGEIIAFQRPEGSGSQSTLQKLMGELPIRRPQLLPNKSLLGNQSMMQQVSLWWQGRQPALGFSFRYFAATMLVNPEAKLLNINGVAPTIENIAQQKYPLTSNFYAVTRGEPKGEAKEFIAWILSTQGQEIIEKTGYVPLIVPNQD
jgi:phosphate transport system substrate-binding protein